MKNLIFLALCFLVTALQAQQTDAAAWTHHQFVDEVNDIAETPTDIWFATNNGLVRMNKTTEEKTLYHPYNSPLPRLHVETLAVDADGQLFIGVYDNIMARFDGNDDWDIIDIPVDADVVSANQTSRLFKIFVDDENEKWLGTTSGLLHYQPDGEWEIFNNSTLGTEGISFGEVWDITQTDNGDMYISSLDVHKYDGENFTNITEEIGELFAYANTSIAADGDAVWYTNGVTDIARYSESEWEIIPSDGSLDLPAGQLKEVRMDASGIPHLLYNSSNAGLYKLENGAWAQVVDAQTTAITQSLNTLFFDENNGRWLTARGEIFHNDAGTFSQIQLQDSPLNSANIRFVEESPMGGTYCYSEWISGRKLVRFDSPTEWEEIELSDDFTDMYDMKINNDGILIVSTSFGVFSYENGVWIQIPGLPMFTVPFLLAIDSQNGIWLSTSSDGLYYHNGSVWEAYNTTTSGLSNDLISSISVDRNDGLWTVTQNQNLEHFDGTNWEIFNATNSSLPAILDNSDLYFDENNELWFPNFNYGTYHYDGTTWEEFIIEPVNTFIQYKIGANADGTLYLASSWGIYQFNGATWQPFLNTANSLLLQQDSPDFLIDQNDFFWMSTDEGLFIYDAQVVSVINNPTSAKVDFITVFPNPATDFISFKMSTFDEEIHEMNLYDNSGRLLRSEQVNSSAQVHVADLPAGIYYVKLSASGKSQIGKFVK